MTQKSKDFKLPSFKHNIDLKSRKDFVEFHRNVKGINLFERYHPAHEYIKKAEEDQLWLEKRELRSAPLTKATVKDP